MDNLKLSSRLAARVEPYGPEPFRTPQEAADYLGVTPQVFNSLMKQFGVGRYHLAREHDQIVFSLKDIEHVKQSIHAALVTLPPRLDSADASIRS
jgi:hypothetical protein